MGVVQLSMLPKELTNYGQNDEKTLFLSFVRSYLGKTHRSERYKKMYRNTIDHLVQFCNKNNIDLDTLFTNSIGVEFCENFVHYLKEDRQLMINTVKGHSERLNAMLQKAVLYGHKVNNTYKEVSVSEEEVSAIFLSMTEITRIYYFQNLTKVEKEIKDYFIIGCLTGLRYSDYSRLNSNNFDKITNTIRIKTQKTGAVVSIPMHKFVREILQKYDYKLPAARCIQQFNKIIKRICKKVGINDSVLWERTVGTKVIIKQLQKWELVSSHTARRSFATNMFLQNIPTYRIMMITGHKSESSFFKYIRVTREENAATLSGHLFFQ